MRQNPRTSKREDVKKRKENSEIQNLTKHLQITTEQVIDTLQVTMQSHTAQQTDYTVIYSGSMK